MDNASRAPYLSEPIQVSNVAARTGSFGDSWEEIVTRVEAFIITLGNNCIHRIKNLTHDETPSSIESYRVDVPEHIFVLFPGESVFKVEVFLSESAITAIKLHTTMRQTPWVGTLGDRRTSFESSEGFCINAFYGEHGQDGCSQLGVVFAPSAIVNEGHSIAIPPTMSSVLEVRDEGSGDEYDFCTFCQAPSAIVVRMSAVAIVGIRFVTNAEYQRLMLFDKPFKGMLKEQWIILVDGEQIKQINVAVYDSSIVSVSFRTNLRTTPERGKTGEDSMEQHIVSPPGTFICGFRTHATLESGEYAIDSLQAMVAPVETDALKPKTSVASQDVPNN